MEIRENFRINNEVFRGLTMEGLRVPGCGLGVSGVWFLVSGWGLRVASCGLGVSGVWFLVSG